MTADISSSIRASRLRVPRTRGATSGLLLLALGAWAALVPFIGPYLNVAFTPAPNDAWHWTSGRGWLNVLPGALTLLGGLLLLMSRSRLVTSFGAWLAILSGAWLVVGPALSPVLNLSPGQPDPASREGVRALASLVFFYGIGAAILFVASLALGRLSVHSVRDVRAAERRAAAEEAAAEEERRAFEERVAAQRRNDERAAAERRTDDGPHGDQAVAAGAANGYSERPDEVGRHERTAEGRPPGAGDQTMGQQRPVQQQPVQQPTGQQQAYTPAPPPPEQR
jgi:hypothetical protein